MSPTFPTVADADRSEVMSPHMTKYYLPDGRVLHHFTGADPVDDFHDHPFPFQTWLDPAGGGYVEEVLTTAPDGTPQVERFTRLPGVRFTVGAGTRHRLVELPGGECFTVITPGGWQQEPAFYRTEGSSILRRQWNQPDWRPLPTRCAEAE